MTENTEFILTIKSNPPLVYRQLELTSIRINGTGSITIESVDAQSERKPECNGVLGSVHYGKKEKSEFAIKFNDRACFQFDVRIKTRFITYGNITTTLCSAASVANSKSCCSGLAKGFNSIIFITSYFCHRKD